MRKNLLLVLCSLLLVCVSCNQGGKSVDVNTQQKPRLLVMPSDQLLQNFSKIKTEDAQGKTIYIRDYPGYLLADNDSKFIISTIQNKFTQFGYPLNDLEQTLKQINDQEMIDEVDGIKKDAKTILLTSAKPDIILELDYSLNMDKSSHSKDKKLTYTLKAIDAFTNKVVATAQTANFDDAKDKNATGANAFTANRYPIRFVLFDNFRDCYEFVSRQANVFFQSIDLWLNTEFPDVIDVMDL